MGSNAAVCKLYSAARRWHRQRGRHALIGGLLVLAGCAPAPSSAPAFADRSRGARLAAQYQCGSCHTIPGVAAAQGKAAPSLAAIGRRSFIAGRIPNRDPLLARWIADPASLVPDTLMPNMGVSAADARDIAAYLRELR